MSPAPILPWVEVVCLHPDVIPEKVSEDILVDQDSQLRDP